MPLSKKRKEDIQKALTEGDEVIEYLREKGILKRLNLGTSVFLGYVSSVNLVQHSKTLNLWTKVLAGTAIAMSGLAIAQLVVLLSR